MTIVIMKKTVAYKESACDTIANGAYCQPRILDIENSKLSIYNLNTVGTTNMITVNGQDRSPFSENKNQFTSTVALLRT